MNSLFKCVGFVLIGAVMVQAQTMRVYKTQNATIDYVVSDIDSIAFNTQRDTMQVYYPKGKPAIKFKVSDVDSVQFSAGLNYGTLVDSRDGQVYKTIVIGSQTWMAQNLNYGTYISKGSLSATLQSGAQKFCYNDAAINCTIDGGLYQWHTAMGYTSSCATNNSCTSHTIIGIHHQGICPEGWHVPKPEEWNILQVYLGGSTIAGSKMKLNNTGNTSWDTLTYNTGNSFGFSGLPVGCRREDGSFNNRRFYAFFWGTTQLDLLDAYTHILMYDKSGLLGAHNDKKDGFSLRCVKD
jgi:uncharacterized protein (TIGR02145 family)